MKTTFGHALFFLIVAGTWLPAKAAIVVQGPVDTFLAFEAELTGTIVNDAIQSFVNISDGAASGGGALEVIHPTMMNYNAGGTNGSTATSFDTYSLEFVTPGNYTLYYTIRTDPVTLGLGDTAAGNSFVYSGSLNGTVNTLAASNGMQNYVNYNFFGEPGSFFVPVPGMYTFTIGDREAGAILDRFAFSSVALNQATFNSLPNSIVVPEPGAFSVIALCGVAALSIRRMRREGNG